MQICMILESAVYMRTAVYVRLYSMYTHVARTLIHETLIHETLA